MTDHRPYSVPDHGLYYSNKWEGDRTCTHRDTSSVTDATRCGAHPVKEHTTLSSVMMTERNLSGFAPNVARTFMRRPGCSRSSTQQPHEHAQGGASRTFGTSTHTTQTKKSYNITTFLFFRLDQL